MQPGSTPSSITLLRAAPGSVSLLKAGKIKSIAVTSAKRIGALPDVPTVAESGVPGYEASVWYGVVAPAKTPKEVVTKLNAEIGKILRERNQRDKIAAADFEVTTTTPEEFGKFIRSETEKWGKVVKASGARAE